jgi:hypothetical protein
VEGGDALPLGPCRGLSRPDGPGQGGSDLLLQGLPLAVLLLRQGQNTGVGPVHGLISVLLPDLPAVLLLVGLHGTALERLEFFLVGHFYSSLCLVNGLPHRQDETVQPDPPGLQLLQVALQRRLPVKGRVVQNPADGGQLQPKLPVKENVLEPVHLSGAVEAVARLRGPQGLQQALTVIPAQGPGRDARQLRQGFHSVFHVRSLLTKESIDHDAAARSRGF